MRNNTAFSILLAGLLLFGTATAVDAQTSPEDHEAHHPEQEEQAVPEQPTDMPGMGMMTPEMMTPEMMRMMQRMMGQGGMMGRGGMGPGMTGQAGMPGMMGQGMMGQGMMGDMPMAGGMMMCPMMQMGAGPGMGMQPMMGGAMFYGMPHGKVEEMTPERVRTFLEQRLEKHGNPRLKLGEIARADDGSITAEIVTVDGSLVQKLAFNRYPGLFRQVTE